MQVGEHVVDQKKLYTGLFIIGTSPQKAISSPSYPSLLRIRHPAALVRRSVVYFLLARRIVIGSDHGTRQFDGTGIGEVSLSPKNLQGPGHSSNLSLAVNTATSRRYEQMLEEVARPLGTLRFGMYALQGDMDGWYCSLGIAVWMYRSFLSVFRWFSIFHEYGM